MKIGIMASILALFAAPACATNGTLIITPVKDSIVSATYRLPVVYETAPDANDNDLQVYIDGTRVDALRQAKREIELEPITTGKHRICLALNGNAQAQPGVQSCVDVIAR